jgi:hypothetical protein
MGLAGTSQVFIPDSQLARYAKKDLSAGSDAVLIQESVDPTIADALLPLMPFKPTYRLELAIEPLLRALGFPFDPCRARRERGFYS